MLRFRRSHYGFPEILKTTAVVRNDNGFTLGWGCTFLVTIWSCSKWPISRWTHGSESIPLTHKHRSSLFLKLWIAIAYGLARGANNTPRALELLRSGNYSLFALRSYTHEGKPRGSIMSAPPAKNVRFKVCSNIKSSGLSYINFNA